MRSALIACFCAVVVSARNPLHYGKPPLEHQHPIADAGEALNLSPYLPKNAQKAQEDSLVGPLPGWDKKSYSGFFTTEAVSKKNMFWWYFPAQSGNADAPLVIWLQGGPGGSSLFGLFAEMGPFGLSSDLKLLPRNTSWNVKSGMLFIDNPVGAGFSYTGDTDGYCTDTKDCVSANLYSLLQQFYQVFPDQLKVPLFITGESYGGHYVPGISAYIHKKNTVNHNKGEVVIPLAGMAIGDGWIDPVNMLPGYPDMVYNMGMCDEQEKLVIEDYCNRTVEHIKEGNMAAAFNVWDQMLNGDIWPYANYFHNITGSNDYDNFLNTNAPASFDYYAKYVNQPFVRKALHVGNTPFGTNASDCEMALVSDFMATLKPELETMLQSTTPHYKVLVYSGQLDVIIGAALTERFLPNVEWQGQAAYNKAHKAVWRINPSDVEVAGYARTVGNFSQVIVRAAGHIVPGDQPERALDMITRFIEGTGYEHLPNPKA